MYYNRWHREGEPGEAERRFGEAHHNWTGDAVTYSGMHIRVRNARGRAAEHECVHCGSAAEQWAYDHLDPDPRVEGDQLYSLSVDHYIPLCIPCHKAYDAPQPKPKEPRGTPASERTHCPQGHTYSDENTYRTPSGHRRCKECNRQRARDRYQPRKKELQAA